MPPVYPEAKIEAISDSGLVTVSFTKDIKQLESLNILKDTLMPDQKSPAFEVSILATE